MDAVVVGERVRPGVEVRFSSMATEAMYRAASRQGVSMSVFLHAAWAILLRRYGREEGISFDAVEDSGAIPAPPSEAATKRSSGIRTLQVEVSADLSVDGWLAGMAGPTGGLESGSRAGPNGSPGQRRTEGAPGAPPGSLVIYRGDEPDRSGPTEEEPDYGLVLQGFAGERFLIRLSYDPDLFEQAEIEKMVGHLRRLMVAMAVEREKPLADLPMLSEGELRKLLLEWNATATTYPRDRCLHGLFEAHAETAPEAVAVVCEERSWTYGELNERANRLAHRLRELGVGPDVVVGMCFERGLEMILGLLGILKAGGAYLPLDAALPRERLRYMLEDAKARALVTRKDLAGDLPETGVPVVLVDGEESVREGDTRNPGIAVRPEHLAYVIYTSGSTGRPKGVGVEHGQLLNYAYGIRDRLGVTPGTSCATVSTLSADLGNTSIFSALAWGGSLHVISGERIFNGEALASYFRRHRIDLLKITPSHLAALQSSSEPAALMPRRWLVLGGEASSLKWVGELARVAPDCQIFNHYGPTEATVGVLTYRVDASLPETASGTLPLGRPLPNSRMYVVDAGLHPVPIGVPGELLIGGAGVARGYLDRPELTAERFIANPFGEGRLYRTGDLVRYLPDGNLEFLGRIDFQVKIRGYRVEPGEVEAVLGDHPSVRECAVVAREDHPGDIRLVAYVVGDEVDPVGLRDHLKQNLQDHMVPSAIVPMDALPLSANGKLDRKALPAPVAPEPAPLASTPPRDEVERWLVREWQDLLAVEQIGVQDDFFALGGHSLLAVRLFTRIGRKFGVDLPLASLFAAPTIEACARLIRERREAPPEGRSSSPGWRHLVAIQPEGSGPPLFCVCGIGGHVLNLHDLAHEMGTGQPFYGIQALGVDGVSAPLTRVEDMARAYLEEVRAVQPTGPYRIAGHSAGGVMAYEMAYQLLTDGEAVDLLALFDTFCPGGPPAPPSAPPPTRTLRERVGWHAGELLQRGPLHVYEMARHKISKLVRPWAERLAPLPLELGIRAHRRLGRPLSFNQRRLVIERATLEAFDHYRVPEIPGRPVVFTAEFTPKPFRHLGRDRGWGAFAEEGVEVRDVPGGHNTLLAPPNVSIVAGVLRELLDRPPTPKRDAERPDGVRRQRRKRSIAIEETQA